ncbi:centromere-associated protein E isoform X5 [Dicentrarchus labrax]|uniref:centromere-associated protein E isoform X5 n=1 Tax=Dicentrarchus labrax TaxID=13489 RepID=UPI0021F5FB69|nr:centromere-associated protein E isoform X5 [Dicentrarchus labrax]
MTEESAVKVCVRVRPLIEREESAVSENPEPVQLFWKADKKSIHQVDDGNSTKSFSFDRVFTAEETTNQLYQDIAKPLVVSSVEGYNGTIFAYGQTSSGKTFTMMGSDRIPGVIPLAVEDVFQTIKNCPKKEFLLRVSYMEIYNETVTDLLVDSWKRKPLEVRETINKNIYVADLTEELVTSPAQALSWIRKGEKNRHYGKTKMNQRSSRSHTIFRMILESRERSDPASGENADGAIIVSHLNLVDLAGSERASQTGAEGTRFKEGCNINRSLFTLGQVIKKLTDEGQKGFTNYRDSKLTRILQNSLGGNAKTVIICTITPVTLDETLSTLQFASTAKKMKNDPHVTEVSDDGALLKRYRNEIVDLKRRLNEVSSVTQTTATEKEVLSQLLQEKDQLQREQQDRIKNLTKLLVTSSNLVPVQRMPKRRVTWGGKMLRLARQSGCGPSDLSFAESFTRKRKADHSCLMELGEDDESFDSHWGIPDEPSDEMEMSQASVTVRSFGDSPKDFVSPDRMQELSGKLSHLELQLEMESQQKEEAMAKVDTLDGKVTELQLQLQTEAEQKHEALEKIQTAEKRAAELQLQLQLQTESQQKNEALENIQMTEQRAAELELQLQTEAQQKQEAAEKVEMLEFRVADLERQLEEQSHTQSATDEQMRREFAETIQLCETLASEKEMVVGERDYLKQELGMFIEQTESLEKEKAALAQELEERRELDEFKSLEEEFKKEHENELQKEISHLKKAVETSELQCLELQNKLETLSEDLKKKSDFAEELQSMSGKDLVQEVAKLRRSLDDAEGVSRDTKKEWAVLRSEHIALEEENVTLTANHEKLEAEVNSLRFQLETEKSRYRKMQSDLQKELNVAFDENTKLTTLLDGKVPKNLIDSVELERTVTSLSKELMASREAEEALRAQLEELASLQTLPDKVDHLMKQVCELTEKLCAVETHRNSLLSTQAQCQEEAQQLRDSLQTSQDEILKIQADLSAAALREEELSQQCADLTQQLDSLRLDLECSDAEKSQNMATIEETGLKLEESERHRTSLEEKVREVQQLMKGLEETLADSEVSRATEEEISKELQEQLNQLTEELQCVRAEKEQNAGAQSSAEEMEKLLSTVSSLTAERDQLKMDLEENVEMMIENQEELRTALEKSREQRERIKQLETAQTSKQDGPNDTSAQQEEPQTHIQTLTEELESVRAERDGLLSERTADSHSEETEKLLHRVTSLSEERDQLQETLEGLRQEKKQLEDKMETLQTEIAQLSMSLQTVTEQKGQLEDDLQQNMNMASATQELLKSVQDELCQQKQVNSDLEKLSQEKECSLDQQMRTVTEKLQRVEAERDGLLSEKETNSQSSTEETEKLLHRVTSLSEERDQLQEILEGLRQEKKQLQAELEDKMETLQTEMWTLSEKLRSIEAERDGLLSEKETNSQRSTEEMEKLVSRVTSLSEEREQLQEKLEGLRQEKKQLQAELEDRMEMVSAIQEKLNVQQEGERGEREAKLQQQVQQLEEQLQMFRKRETQAEAAADTSQQLLSEANTTISALKEQLSTLDQNTSGVTETASSRLQVSTGQLQESFRRFQHLIDTCSKYNSSVLDKALRGQSSLKQPLLTSLPKPTMNAYSNVCKLGLKTVQSLGNITEHLQARAQGYRNLFEELVKKDLAIFEERRLQDVLLCRVQAPSYSVKEEDFHTMWEHRLTELLEKRQLYLQKMATVLEKLWANIASFPSELSSEIRERERFKEQLGAVLDNQPISFSRLDSILSCELDRRSAMVHSRKMILQGIVEEQNGLCEELKLLEAQADSQHQGERGNSSTLLQALEGAPLKTELSLLKDNQQLVLQLQQTEEKVKALSVQNEQLEHDQIKANNRVSNHKQATQLLQTELQDSRAQVEEKDGMIQTLRSKLRESEKNASPSAVEMEKLQTKLFKMEVELSSASAKHQQEIQSLNTLVSEKEDSLRKLKETLRKLQQQGDDSFLQGEDLHARLTNPRGLVIRSSIVLEKTKLEEEVKQLQLKITELEGLVSSQQAEIGKWKARAIKLKVKTKAEVDKPSPPCTPTKRGLATTSDSSTILSSPKKFLVTPRKVLDSQGNVLDSPRKLLDSPKVPRLDSPKSRFFDVAVSSEVLSRTRPKQFFDNSNLGTIPEVSQVPDTADAEEDEAVGAQNKEEWWPTSPKQEDMCKSQ